MATYGPSGGVTPFNGYTVFEIRSVITTFTTAVIADTVRTGEVALGDPVASLLPQGTVVPARNGREITLLYLATHSSGRLPMWHNGGTGGYRSFTGYDDESGLGVVALASRTRSSS